MSSVHSAVILLSIQSEHACQIYSGTKRAELRKSFPLGARLVFLYETAPVAAVTGAFVIEEARKLALPDAIQLAEEKGVSVERARKYYGDREEGWVVGVGEAVRFKDTIPLSKLKQLNHYFAVPQAFVYLAKCEALTQELLAAFLENISAEIRLREIRNENRVMISRLIRNDVASSYEDIDEDFIRQVLDTEVGATAAFSTLKKHVLEVCWREHIVGFSVLTEKVHGAWKTGPTILLPEYRGIRYGVALRSALEKYCAHLGVSSIYCTCSDSQPGVVSYLLTSGMSLQARLVAHLARDRDELVFAKSLSPARQSYASIRKVPGASQESGPVSVVRLRSSNARTGKALRFFVKNMPHWYFRPKRGLERSILVSLQSYENGVESYSSKSRVLYGAYDEEGRVAGVVLATIKRSKMAKLNLVLRRDARKVAAKLLRRAIADLGGCRRLYGTIPACKYESISAFQASGFAFEGILQNPFLTSMDHVCFGRVVAREVRRTLRQAVGPTETNGLF